jgi:type I restriction enzyme, S subunit
MKWQTEDGRLFEDCAAFFKVTEEFGGLSNMAGGYPLLVAGIAVPSSEALYQACRFPHRPEWQREIIAQQSPMAAKMKAKKEGRRKNHFRSDWEQIEVQIMDWVLRVKLAQHYPRMPRLLRATGNRPIVEQSRKDRFWGAVEERDGVLRGQNRLGQLLMDLREFVEVMSQEELTEVPPLALPGFRLIGESIGVVRAED